METKYKETLSSLSVQTAEFNVANDELEAVKASNEILQRKLDESLLVLATAPATPSKPPSYFDSPSGGKSLNYDGDLSSEGGNRNLNTLTSHFTL